MNVQVFDKPMCCSSGVCGPSVDPVLARFSADLDWLRQHGASVERFNLAQQPQAFAADGEVQTLLQSQGLAALPIVRVEGRIQSAGSYPARETLAAWCQLSPALAELTVAPTCCGGQSGCCG